MRLFLFPPLAASLAPTLSSATMTGITSTGGKPTVSYSSKGSGAATFYWAVTSATIAGLAWTRGGGWTVTAGTIVQSGSFSDTFTSGSGTATAAAATTGEAASTSYQIALIWDDGTNTSAVSVGTWATIAAGTSVAPGTGSLTITGYVPTIAQPQTSAPGIGALTITGYAPSISQPQTSAPGYGSLTITGYAPNITQAAGQSLAPGVGTITITGFAPSLAQTANQAVAPNFGALMLTGYAPTVTQASSTIAVYPAVGTLSVVGYAPTIQQTGASLSPVGRGLLGDPKGGGKHGRKATHDSTGLIDPNKPIELRGSFADQEDTRRLANIEISQAFTNILMAIIACEVLDD